MQRVMKLSDGRPGGRFQGAILKACSEGRMRGPISKSVMQINAWLQKKSKGLIKKILEGGIVNNFIFNVISLRDLNHDEEIRAAAFWGCSA